MYILKFALFFFLAFLDAEFTKRKLSESGIEVELNPIIRKFCKWFGIERGVDLGVVIPTGGVVLAGWFFPPILTFCLGARFTLFLFQSRAYGE